ncbi:cache domain-containing sensor histidine kinase [Metabacillus halosaccharovorans]|uniref:cache domain-containing sensor histidine kinase n=1 Tax=Metabacillus halosaccharovorans TaxID=930124 RepID=UPI001C1F4A30|nr:sensor histidine kinase [Metabacillus halosaccharovorans]MBU7594905.1 sensor histidine kinase [Metabacillus halosaccharovorans]
MKSLIRVFNNMKIQSKIVVSFMVAVMIPLLMVGIFLTHELRSTALDDAKEQSAANVERVKKRTAEALEKAIYVSDNVTLDPQLERIVNTTYQTTQEVFIAYDSYTKFAEYKETFKEISNIRLYTENTTMLNNWEFIPQSNEKVKPFWYHSAERANGLIGWFYIPDETKNDQEYLSLVRNIKYSNYKTNAVLVINIRNDYLYEILSQEQSPMMVVDENNNIVVSNRKEYIGKKLLGTVESEIPLDGATGSYNGKLDGEDAEVLIDTLLTDDSQNELKFVSVIPNKVIMADADRFVKHGLLVMGISLIVALFLITFFTKILSNRIITLNRQIKRVGEGNLDAVIHVQGSDEIGLLSNQINKMVTNIKELIDEVEKVHIEKNILEKRQQEIKLKMMASQINPHFLFNALESIRMKAHIKGEKEIASVVKVLGKLMRKSISVTGEMVPLKHEIDLIKCYLDIQKFRYGDRLDYQLKIDPNSEQILINPLIIQPLVENAVIHGLENKEKDGKVIVEVKVNEHFLTVCVLDNGVGMSEEKLKTIKETLKNVDDNRENRIGLLNVHQRLSLTFGEQSGLQIESHPSTGTEICFVIDIRGNLHV